MPIFEFQCNKCGYEFEQIVKSSEKQPTDFPCAFCKVGNIIKKPSAGSFIIKGYSEANGYSKK